MSNMPYCRFQNTLSDLQECHLAIGDYYEGDGTTLSKDEKNAMLALIELCKQIAEENAE